MTPTGTDPLPRLADALTDVSARLRDIGVELRTLQTYATASPPVPAVPPAADPQYVPAGPACPPPAYPTCAPPAPDAAAAAVLPPPPGSDAPPPVTAHAARGSRRSGTG